MTKYYAHSLEGEPPEKWQPLEEHLKNVAEIPKKLARHLVVISGSLANLWYGLGRIL